MDPIAEKLIESYERQIAELSAQRDIYRTALKRLASSEAFHSPGAIDPELRIRMNYAEATLKH